jgi:hypothetical protein
METCEACGNPLDDAGFTNCGKIEACDKDRVAFAVKVENVKLSITLPALASMEKNEMPACFAPTREAVVALAAMTMQALRQNQEMADRLRAIRAQGGDTLH